MSEGFKGAAKLGTGVVAAGVAAGLVTEAWITLRNHREKTHRSITLHPALQAIAEFDQQSVGMDTDIWASVHRIHHKWPDMSGHAFYEIYRMVNWLNANPDNEVAREVAIPQSFKFLDPYVEKFDFDEVMAVGKVADQEIRERLGDRYQEPTGYTRAEINKFFDPEEPLYYYDDIRRHEGEYTQSEIARLLLTDPHSPSLVRPKGDVKNGVRIMHRDMVGHYKQPSNMFKDDPSLKPKDLHPEHGTNKKTMTTSVIGGFVVPAVGVALARRKFSTKDMAIAAAAGSAINGMRIAVMLEGGKLTNAFGHMGDVEALDFLRAFYRKEYKIQLNEDGSVSTNTVRAGLMGKAASWFSNDEVGGQDGHHKNPDHIAYDADWRNAPWGTFIDQLAASKRFPLINLGPGFDIAAGERRPDEPHVVVTDVVWGARRADMARAA